MLSLSLWRMRVISIGIAFTNAAITSMNIHFGSLISGNVARCIYGFTLGIVRPGYFVSTSLPHSPLAFPRHDMLSFSRHFLLPSYGSSDEYTIIPAPVV